MNNEPDDLLAALPENMELQEPEPGLLEADLRRTLRHRDPPAGFADSVMRRALAGDRPGSRSAEAAAGQLVCWPQRRFWLSGAIAAGVTAGIFAGAVELQRFREQQRRVAEATRQFQTTERVTMHALAQAREQLQRAGVSLDLD